MGLSTLDSKRKEGLVNESNGRLCLDPRWRTDLLFSEREEKLIRLGLDPAASAGEVANSATALFQSLRKRAVRPEALIEGAELRVPSWSDAALERAARVKMPFGKHKGREIGVIEPGYLRWCLRECDNLSLALRESIRLVLSTGSRP
jgi:hypothetical protein